MNSVFIFGAGASVHAGAPTMADFLDRASAISRRPQNWEGKEHFTRVFEAQSDLRTIFAKATLDLDNVEVFFGAAEMAVLLEKLGDRPLIAIKKVRESLVYVIARTLEELVRLPVANRRIHSTSSVQTLISHVPWGDGGRYSFMSFNYDVVLDVGIMGSGLSWSYHLTDETDEESRIPLLKLHGSQNWKYCTTCKEVFYLDPTSLNVNHDRPEVTLGLMKIMGSHERCGKSTPGIPILVPPTWNKAQQHGQIGNVWKQAAKELARAHNIFVIGYSLPETDYFFRFLYALGSDSSTRIRSIHVFNPDESVQPKYDALFGSGVKSKVKYHFGKDGRFEQATGPIVKALTE